MPSHFKVHDSLTRPELDELEAFVRERPGCTVDDVHEWVQAKGYTISRSACGTWKKAFEDQEMVRRMQGSGSLAQAFMAAAKDSGGLAIPDAAMTSVAQLIFESSARLQSEGDVSPGDLAAMTLSLQRLTLAKGRLEKTRTEFEERQRRAVTEAGKVAEAGGDGRSVVEKVREILGIGPMPAAGGAK